MSKELTDWLKGHKLINISGLAEMVGMNKGNLLNYVKVGCIPDKYVTPIIEVLKKYVFEDKRTLQNVVQNIEPPVEVEDSGKVVNMTDIQNKAIPAPIIENAVDDTKEEKEVSTEQVNSFIERITAIQKETLPPDIKTPFGKKVWLNDQRKKIEAIREEINKAV